MRIGPLRWRRQPLQWWVRRIPFALMHLLPLGIIWTGATAKDYILCASLYAIRMFFVTAGYHRYFSHRSFRAGRVVQFVLALGAQTSAQKGALWWAAHHRHHHRYSDQPEDVHSPQHGFLYSHLFWVVDPKNRKTQLERVKDLARYPELRLLNRWHWLPAGILGASVYFIGGWSALFAGFFLSTLLLYHGTFSINSLAHVWGTRRYPTADTSRNNAFLALITLGEGWHNNHHHMPGTARQGRRWWEIDITYAVLRAAETLGLVWGVRSPATRPVTASG